MQYYNAKDKFIMKGAIAASAALLGHGRGGATEIAALGGASRGVRRVRRGGGASRRVRRGGASRGRLLSLDDILGGGKRPFRKRTCRSKSRCGGGESMGRWGLFRVPDRLH